MATQVMQAMGPSKNGSMKPSLPSPTLTNPDMLLPNETTKYPSLPSPQRYARRDRPPSPSYLREQTDESRELRSVSSTSSMATKDKEKRGLMSRKMMLLRSRTASHGIQHVNGTHVHHQASPDLGTDGHAFGYASSPTLMDVGNLAQVRSHERQQSNSGSSQGSDDLSSLPQLLSQYEASTTTGTDEDLWASSPAAQRYGYAITTDSLEEERRQKQDDEHASAILSQRAEQILANAKKRLNVRICQTMHV